MRRTAVINVVGLSQSLVGKATPRIEALADRGSCTPVVPAFPAVTCTAQSNYVTGRHPTDHGIVGNGWFNRSLAEVHFWKQSNHLVQAPKVWDDLRERSHDFTCAKIFWWYNMYSTADYSITPRPMYPADGRKVFDVYTWPHSIRYDIKSDLGEFPFPAFWGPAAGVDSPKFSSDAVSKWIAHAAKWFEEKFKPTLSLVYLPHLDYNLQRWGPGYPGVSRDLEQIDGIVGDLLDFYQSRSIRVLLLSEYGIAPVDKPVHLNRLFRERGWLAVKEEMGLELLDCGASKVFAVADHQVAHIYLNDRLLESDVRKALKGLSGIERVISGPERAEWGIAHERAGDLITVADPNAWFTYYYWMDDRLAPDFARTVDIHRKPGYDPVELFLDPARKWIKATIAWKLLRKNLGFRMLMDVVPLDASLVKGSHGRIPADAADGPIMIVDQASLLPEHPLRSTDVYGVIRSAVLAD